MAAKTAEFRIIRQLVRRRRRRRSRGHVELQSMTIVIIIGRLNGTNRQTKKQTKPQTPTFSILKRRIYIIQFFPNIS
jgi:hypothetical protein